MSAPLLPPTAPGPTNAVEDVGGLRVGHYGRSDGGFLTGTTVVLGPDEGMVAGVDVRGGGPGSRETDLLAPTATVDRITALVLTGGSAYGLAAAAGVADGLGAAHLGFPVGADHEQVVPIVPAAVIFDLGRGGDFGARPDADFGAQALQAARMPAADRPPGPAAGGLGVGTGAVAGGLKGGIGGASALLPDGTVVGAMVVVNAAGSAVDPATGTLWGQPLLLPGDAPRLTPPTPDERAALAGAAARGGRLPQEGPPADGPPADGRMRNTTVGVLATDASLTKTQCCRLAAVGHNGFARALNPVHTLFDGDSVFAVSTARRPPPDLLQWQQILSVAPNVVTRAIVRAMLAARTVTTSAGSWHGYADLAPSTLAPDVG